MGSSGLLACASLMGARRGCHVDCHSGAAAERSSPPRRRAIPNLPHAEARAERASKHAPAVRRCRGRVRPSRLACGSRLRMRAWEDGPAHNLSLSVEKITSSYDACAAECRQSDSLPTPGQARILPAAKTGVGPTPAGSGGSMAERYNAAVAFVDRHLTEGRAEKVAFRDPRRALTYGELHDQASRVGPALAALGIAPEHRVLMLMLDTVDFPVVFWGAIRAGIIPVPLNTLLGPEQYAYVLEDSRAPLVVASAPLLPAVEAAIAASGRRVKVVVAGAEPAATSADEVAFWLYSSGSTGMPKGVKHVHSSLIETARLYGEGVLGIAEDDVVYSAAKLFFAYGLGNAMTFPMAVGATAALLDERPTPKSVFSVMQREQPTIFFGVPTLSAAMLNAPDWTSQNGSRRLRLCASAGEALPAQVGLAWRKKFGVYILDGPA